MRVVPGPKMGVLGPLRGPRGRDFNPILTRKSIKTTKNILKPIHLQDNSIKTYKKYIFTLEIPINTLVPRRIRVVIGNPSDNPQKPQIWARGPKKGVLGPRIGQKRAYFVGNLGPEFAPRAQIFRPQN